MSRLGAILAKVLRRQRGPDAAGAMWRAYEADHSFVVGGLSFIWAPASLVEDAVSEGWQVVPDGEGWQAVPDGSGTKLVEELKEMNFEDWQTEASRLIAEAHRRKE